MFIQLTSQQIYAALICLYSKNEESHPPNKKLMACEYFLRSLAISTTDDGNRGRCTFDYAHYSLLVDEQQDGAVIVFHFTLKCVGGDDSINIQIAGTHADFSGTSVQPEKIILFESPYVVQPLFCGARVFRLDNTSNDKTVNQFTKDSFMVMGALFDADKKVSIPIACGFWS